MTKECDSRFDGKTAPLPEDHPLAVAVRKAYPKLGKLTLMRRWTSWDVVAEDEGGKLQLLDFTLGGRWSIRRNVNGMPRASLSAWNNAKSCPDLVKRLDAEVARRIAFAKQTREHNRLMAIKNTRLDAERRAKAAA